MTFSAALDVAIGLVLVYSLFSVAASKINEFVANLLNTRASGLEKGLRRLLEGGTDAQQRDTQIQQKNATKPVEERIPLISETRLTLDKLKQTDFFLNESAPGRGPAYLRPRTFALAVLDLLVPPRIELVEEMREAAAGNDEVLAVLIAAGMSDDARVAALKQALHPPKTKVPIAVPPDSATKLDQLVAAYEAQNDQTKDPIEHIQGAVDGLPDHHPAKKPLLRFLMVAGNDRDKLIDELEGWYNGVMARMSGWYKRRAQKFLIAFGLVLVLLFNLDTLAIAGALYRDGGTRQAVATAAAAQAGKSPQSAGDAIRKAESLSIPMGWVLHQESGSHLYDGRHLPSKAGDWFLKLFGLAITVGALSFGATFWFDALGKIANLRNNGTKPGTEPGTATKAAD